jgi:magnesium chelatase family protein
VTDRTVTESTKARTIQQLRAGCTNAELSAAALKRHCGLSDSDRKLLAEASSRHALSPRACIRIMKVARTLADLEGVLHIGTAHVAEAISYRGNASRAEAPC